MFWLGLCLNSNGSNGPNLKTLLKMKRVMLVNWVESFPKCYAVVFDLLNWFIQTSWISFRIIIQIATFFLQKKVLWGNYIFHKPPDLAKCSKLLSECCGMLNANPQKFHKNPFFLVNFRLFTEYEVSTNYLLLSMWAIMYEISKKYSIWGR